MELPHPAYIKLDVSRLDDIRIAVAEKVGCCKLHLRDMRFELFVVLPHHGVSIFGAEAGESGEECGFAFGYWGAGVSWGKCGDEGIEVCVELVYSTFWGRALGRFEEHREAVVDSGCPGSFCQLWEGEIRAGGGSYLDSAADNGFVARRSMTGEEILAENTEVIVINLRDGKSSSFCMFGEARRDMSHSGPAVRLIVELCDECKELHDTGQNTAETLHALSLLLHTWREG